MIFGINFFGIKVYLEFFFDENINIIVKIMVCYIVYSVEIFLVLK